MKALSNNVITLRNTCINDTDPDGKYWCSTKVDEDLEHIGGQGNWGFCRESCPLLNPKIRNPKTRNMRASTSSEKPKLNNLEKYISGYIDDVDYYEDYDESYDILR